MHRFESKGYRKSWKKADYPGVRVSMETKFDGVITPLKIDISTGEIITPGEIKYNFLEILPEVLRQVLLSPQPRDPVPAPPH